MLYTVGKMRFLSNCLITFITLTYLCAFLFISIVLSGDIETNPGPKPPKFSSETWLWPDISYSEIFSPGYHVYRKDRADGYGGVLLGISTSLSSNKIETENKFVAAKVLSSKHAIIFAAAYR